MQHNWQWHISAVQVKLSSNSQSSCAFCDKSTINWCKSKFPNARATHLQLTPKRKISALLALPVPPTPCRSTLEIPAFTPPSVQHPHNKHNFHNGAVLGFARVPGSGVTGRTRFQDEYCWSGKWGICANRAKGVPVSGVFTFACRWNGDD